MGEKGPIFLTEEFQIINVKVMREIENYLDEMKKFNDIKLNKSKISADKTKNNYNEIKNHALVTLNTINLEKLKIQKKLAEYNKLIDKKIIKLKKNNKAKKINVYKRKKSSLIKEGNICNINSSKIYLINNKKINKAFFINSFGLNKQNTKRESNTNPTKKKIKLML